MKFKNLFIVFLSLIISFLVYFYFKGSLGVLNLCPPGEKTFYKEKTIYNFCYKPSPKEGIQCNSSTDCLDSRLTLFCIPQGSNDHVVVGTCQYILYGCAEHTVENGEIINHSCPVVN